MTNEEFDLYVLCEEFHRDLRNVLQVKEPAVQLARKLTLELDFKQINRIIEDVDQIK